MTNDDFHFHHELRITNYEVLPTELHSVCRSAWMWCENPYVRCVSISTWYAPIHGIVSTILSKETRLTHWSRDKMASIFQTTFSNAFYWMKMYEFSLKFVRKVRISNIPALFQIMAWRRYAYMRCSASMSQCHLLRFGFNSANFYREHHG